MNGPYCVISLFFILQSLVLDILKKNSFGIPFFDMNINTQKYEHL